MNTYRLEWSHGTAEVLSTAAVLADCSFALPGGPFRPYARAPWMGTVDDPAIIGHLRELGGDFVCVPFGSGHDPLAGAPEWAELVQEPPYRPVHGPAGDAEWTLVRQDAHSVTLALDYPEDSLVARLERTVAGRPGAPALDSELVIHPRRSGRLSVGLHPILRLPETNGRLRLAADFAFGIVHPRHAAPGAALEFSSLSAVPFRGSVIDFSQVPVGEPNLSVQLCGMQGPLRAEFLDEGAGIVLDWDRAVLPSLQLWCTDRGIPMPPWNSRYRGIGVEPIASAFDCNTALSTRDNPISRRGVATAVELHAGVPLSIHHSVSAYSTENGELQP